MTLALLLIGGPPLTLFPLSFLLSFFFYNFFLPQNTHSSPPVRVFEARRVHLTIL